MGYIGTLYWFVGVMAAVIVAYKMLGLNKDIINDYFDKN